MHSQTLKWRASVAFVMSIALCAAGSSTSATADSVSQPNYVNQMPAPADYHVYSVQELAGMFERPKSIPQLIKNLQIVWDKRLLAQPEFFDDAILSRVFNAAKVAWMEAQVRPPPGVSSRHGTIILDRGSFGGTIVNLFSYREVAQARPPSNQTRGYPGYVTDSGAIQVEVEAFSDFTWGAVKAVFGPDATDQGDDTVFEGLPPPNYTPSGKAWMRYLHDGEDPTRFGRAVTPEAVFIIKSDTAFDSSDWRVPRHPKDTARVKSFRIYDSLTQYTIN